MTIDTSDPLERLRAVNPVTAAAALLIEPDPVLLRRLLAGASPAVTGRAAPRRRRGRRLVPALIATSVLGGAGAYGVLRDGVSRPGTVACFELADLTAFTEVVRAPAAGPVEACAGLWRRGVLGAGTEVPPLVACVLPSGVAGVFPAPAGADVCTALDLVPVSPAPARPSNPGQPGQPVPPQPSAPGVTTDVATRIVGFRDAAVAAFLAAPCVSPEAGEDIVRRELARAALGDWTVVRGPFSADRPCATVSVQAEERQVFLVPGTARR